MQANESDKFANFKRELEFGSAFNIRNMHFESPQQVNTVNFGSEKVAK